MVTPEQQSVPSKWPNNKVAANSCFDSYVSINQIYMYCQLI